VILHHVPAPTYHDGAPLQAWVTNLDANPYLGRLALCRVVEGTIRKGQQIAWCRTDGSVRRAKVVELFLTEALTRVPVQSAGPGDLVAVAGLDDVTIGETLADPDDPRPLPVITVDEPALSMMVGINTSPLAGREGDKLTARLVKGRLDAELVGNVSIRVLPTDRPDAWEVQARGELQLAILVETMRREGFELTVGKPEVVTRVIAGVTCEPVERVTIDVPDEHLGAVTQLVAARRGRMQNMVNHGLGWVRLDYLVPARGLIGFRTDFLTETRGTGVVSHVFEGYEPWAGDIRARSTGSLVADRTGPTTTYAMVNLQERASMLVGPGTDVYCGMIVAENSRAGDMDVNICREKKLTNMRAASADETVKLTPPRVLSLEHALEFIAGDECVEVTPKSIRLRKVELDPQIRGRDAKRRSTGAAPTPA
jgi:GTP-binding protein